MLLEASPKFQLLALACSPIQGLQQKCLKALYEANVNIHMISTSEIKISVLIDRADSNKALNAVHDAFEF